jgi:hypothetical protein
VTLLTRSAFLSYEGARSRSVGAVIELLEFNLRGGSDAGRAAGRVVGMTDRYLGETASRDVAVVVTECVRWLAGGEAEPHPLRLELSATSAVVRVAVTERRPAPHPDDLTSSKVMARELPMTVALASRCGVETHHRTRIWAEFDRPAATDA